MWLCDLQETSSRLTRILMWICDLHPKDKGGRSVFKWTMNSQQGNYQTMRWRATPSRQLQKYSLSFFNNAFSLCLHPAVFVNGMSFYVPCVRTKWKHRGSRVRTKWKHRGSHKDVTLSSGTPVLSLTSWIVNWLKPWVHITIAQSGIQLI